MFNKMIFVILFVVLTFFKYAQSGYAQNKKVLYVTDHISITLRTGPSIRNKILRMLSTGTKLYPLGEINNGWIKVKTENGVEGWVLLKYTLSEPPAAIKLKDCMKKAKKIEDLTKENKDLKSKLKALQKEYELLEDKYKTLKEDASNIETIKNNLKKAQKELEILKVNLFRLKKENSTLKSKSNLYWFLAGVFTVLFSFLIGFIMGRIQKRKNRSLYF